MKRLMQFQWMVGVLIFLIALQTASAFYDPAPQRWINRDPIGEAGGHNLYEFVSNEPLIRRDRFGLETEVPNSGGKGGNCLSYALAPCSAAGENMQGLVSGTMGYREMIEKVDAEMKKHGCRKIKAKEKCSKDEYQVNVYYWWENTTPRQPAYHCARQESDGTWSQRNGPNEPIYTGATQPDGHIPDNANKPPPAKYCCPKSPPKKAATP